MLKYNSWGTEFIWKYEAVYLFKCLAEYVLKKKFGKCDKNWKEKHLPIFKWHQLKNNNTTNNGL